MTTHRYSFHGYEKEKMIKVVGRNIPVSTKKSIEVCSFIRGKNLQKAKEMLADVIKKKTAVPFKRFTDGAGHKRGSIASGKYPVKTSEEILKLLNSLEANAQQKGLDTSSLTIKHVCANKASRPPRYGRIRGRLAKRSHVEIVALVQEKETKKKAEIKKEEEPVEEKKPEEPKKEMPAGKKEAKEKPEEKKPGKEKTAEKHSAGQEGKKPKEKAGEKTKTAEKEKTAPRVKR